MGASNRSTCLRGLTVGRVVEESGELSSGAKPAGGQRGTIGGGERDKRLSYQIFHLQSAIRAARARARVARRQPRQSKARAEMNGRETVCAQNVQRSSACSLPLSHTLLLTHALPLSLPLSRAACSLSLSHTQGMSGSCGRRRSVPSARVNCFLSVVPLHSLALARPPVVG